MISRKRVSEGHSGDELDGLIRWSLKEGVADVSPPPEAWGRIRARAERSAAWERLGSHFRNGYRAAAGQLSRANRFFLAQIISLMWPNGRWGEWKIDPYSTRLILEQYGFFNLLRLAF